MSAIHSKQDSLIPDTRRLAAIFRELAADLEAGDEREVRELLTALCTNDAVNRASGIAVGAATSFPFDIEIRQEGVCWTVVPRAGDVKSCEWLKPFAASWKPLPQSRPEDALYEMEDAWCSWRYRPQSDPVAERARLRLVVSDIHRVVADAPRLLREAGFGDSAAGRAAIATLRSARFAVRQLFREGEPTSTRITSNPDDLDTLP